MEMNKNVISKPVEITFKFSTVFWVFLSSLVAFSILFVLEDGDFSNASLLSSICLVTILYIGFSTAVILSVIALNQLYKFIKLHFETISVVGWWVLMIGVIGWSIVPQKSKAKNNGCSSLVEYDLDCSDFSSHSDAQDMLEATETCGYGDYHKLDGDHDGIACESLR